MRACAFVRFRVPELSLDHRKFAALAGQWMDQKSARSQQRSFMTAVRWTGWKFWIEPEDMTAEEAERYRPPDVIAAGVVT